MSSADPQNTSSTPKARKGIDRSRLRITSICAFAFAIVSFALTIVILVAGSKPGQFDDNYMVSVNTSKLGQDLIKFTPVSSSGNGGGGGSSNSDPLSQIGDLLGGLINNATSGIDSGLQNAENQLIEQVVDELGLDDFYNFFLLNICQGNFSDSSNPHSSMHVTKCASYSDKNAGFQAITSKIPDSVTIGTTNVSVPILGDLTSSFSLLSGTVSTLTKAVFAFFVISLIGSGITALASLAGLVLARSALITYLNFAASTLSSVFQFAGAIAITILIKTTSSLVNQFGDGISLHAKEGEKTLIFAWVSWAFIFLVNVYWGLIWFVEARKFAFKLRSRTPDQVGNWRGIFREVRSDLHREPVPSDARAYKERA